MKKLLLILAVALAGSVNAQSDDCTTATPITLTNGTACVTGTTINATSDNVLYSSCNTTSLNEVWYTYTTDGSANTFTVNSLGITNAQIVIYTGGCGVTLETCTNVTGTTQLNASWGLTPGIQVWIGVMSNEGIEGGFELCVDSQAPNPSGGNTCAGAIPICEIGTTYPIDMSPLTSSGVTPSCFFGTGNQDVWITFTVTQAGTIEWSATPQFADVELDWALYDMSGGCPGPPGGPGTLVACNYNYGGAFGDPIGMNDATSCVVCPTSAFTLSACDEFCTEAFLNVGTYAIMIDQYEGTAGTIDFLFTNGTTALISPVADFTASPTLVCGPDMTVTITDNSIGGAPDWTFGNGDTYTGSNPPAEYYNTPGTYAITATIPGACPSTHTEYVQLLAPLAGLANGTPETCAGDCDGLGEVTSISGGDGIYTFQWFDAGMAPIGQSGVTASGLCAGNYTVTVSNATCGTSIDLPISVTTTPLPTVTATAGGNTYCPSDPITDITVDVTGTSGWTVDYTLNGTPTSASGASSPINLGNAPGTYVITGVTDANCSNTASGTETIIINPVPTATINAGGTYCTGDPISDVTVSVTGTGSWTVDYTLDGTPMTATGASSPISLGNTPGTYVLTGVTDALCSNTASGSVAIVVNPTPTVSLTGSDPTTCNGTDGFVTVTGSSSNPVTITWTGTASGSQAGAALPYDITGLAAGTYDVSYVDDVTGCGTTVSQQVLNNPGAPVIDPFAPITQCGGSVTIPNITGSLLTGGQTFYDGMGGTGTTYSQGSSVSSSITLYAYDINGSCSSEQILVITINPLPTAIIAGDVTVCEGSADQTITFTGATGTAPYTFTYTVNGGANQTVVSDATGVATVNQSAATAGTYTYDLVSVEDANLCSQAQTGTAVVTVNPLPTVTITGDATVCEGSADQTITLTGANGTAPYTFTYTLNGGANQTVTSDATGVATVTQSAATAGTFVFDLVDVTDASASACSQTQTGTVTVTVNPLPTATITGDVEVCEGSGDQTITLTGANGTAPYTFTYTVNGGANLTITSDATGVATVTQSSATAGTYIYDLVSVMDASSTACSQAQTGTVVITVNPTPTVSTAGTDPTVCNGTDGFVTVTGSSTNAVTISWSGTATGSQAGTTLPYDITGLGAGTYDVTYVDDVTGCSTTSSQAVLNNPGAPILDPIADVTVCDVFNLQAITGTALTGNETYWSGPGGTGTQYNVGDAITSTITMYAYDINGACPDEEPFLITVNVTPPAPAAGNDTTYCIGASMSPMFGVPSDPQGVISWYDSDQTTLLSTGLNYTPYDNQNTTVYYVTETLAGCEGPASMVTITIQGCDITIPTAITPNSDLSNDDWEILDLDFVYPDNVVQVYNRWGNLVFEHVSSPSAPYDQNRWDGTYEGNALPVGSYYYVIQANDEDETVFTGAISIILDK